MTSEQGTTQSSYLRQENKEMTQTKEAGPALSVGGYRVLVTNWNGNGRETFFKNKFDAIEHLNKLQAYGYKCEIDTIHLIN
jgi:hypothetical protein